MTDGMPVFSAVEMSACPGRRTPLPKAGSHFIEVRDFVRKTQRRNANKSVKIISSFGIVFSLVPTAKKMTKRAIKTRAKELPCIPRKFIFPSPSHLRISKPIKKAQMP